VQVVWLMVLCDSEIQVMNLQRLQKDKKTRRCFGIDAGISSWREVQQYMMVVGVCMCVHKCVCKLLIAW
jgi:hypothetical protein